MNMSGKDAGRARSERRGERPGDAGTPGSQPRPRARRRLRAMTAGRGTVLVVEADAAERERYGSWLEGSGFDVLMCPGPTEPDYTCVGARDGVCPLAEEASVVVLDMSTESEAVMMGT